MSTHYQTTYADQLISTIDAELRRGRVLRAIGSRWVWRVWRYVRVYFAEFGPAPQDPVRLRFHFGPVNHREIPPGPWEP